MVSCTKEHSFSENKPIVDTLVNTPAPDLYFITDSQGTVLPAIQFKIDFKWIDSVHAESYVKLYDKNTGAWYHFSTWNILPLIQQTLIPKYHTYDVYWYNYSQQGNSPLTTRKMVIHSTNLLDSLPIDNVQRVKLFTNVNYQSNNTVFYYFTVAGF